MKKLITILYLAAIFLNGCTTQTKIIPAVSSSLNKTVKPVHQEAVKVLNLTKQREAEQAGIKARLLKENSDQFVDNEDGTVSLKNKSLMWQRCSIGQTWTGINCNGKATQITWNNAIKLKSNFAGYNDWRLPKKDELMALIYCSDGQYKQNGTCKNPSIVHRTINTTYFPNTTTNYFWSSSILANYSGYAWYGSFYGGYSGISNKTSSSNVRLVRG